MSIIKANIPGDEWINAKAGENVIEKLGYERLSWIRVVTEGPVDLTAARPRRIPITTASQRKKPRSILTRPGRSAALSALCSTRTPVRAFTTKGKEEIPCKN